MSPSAPSIRIEREHLLRIDHPAAMKGVSRSAIIANALAAYLSSDGGGQCEAVTARRLERLARQLGRLERGQTLLIETFAFFIRDYLASTAPVREPQEQATRHGAEHASGNSSSGSPVISRGTAALRELEQEFAPEGKASRSLAKRAVCMTSPEVSPSR